MKSLVLTACALLAACGSTLGPNSTTLKDAPSAPATSSSSDLGACTPNAAQEKAAKVVVAAYLVDRNLTDPSAVTVNQKTTLSRDSQHVVVEIGVAPTVGIGGTIYDVTLSNATSRCALVKVEYKFTLE